MEACNVDISAHAQELAGIGWKVTTQDLPNGVTLTATATEAQPLTKLKTLGFMGSWRKARTISCTIS